MVNGLSPDFLRLKERRQKFIDGLDANRGEINLDIFEDFYPDKAHFVYELLQNAEDAGATEVAFTLISDRLVCDKAPLPFNLDDGDGYFETVEFLPELRKRHPQNYLALCPNHSANQSRDTIREEFTTIEGNELPVMLAEKDLTIYFSKTHIVDLKAVLDAEAEETPPPGTGLDDGESVT